MLNYGYTAESSYLRAVAQFLDTFKQPSKLDRATLISVAYTSLATKINSVLASKLAADVVDAVLTIQAPPPKGLFRIFRPFWICV